MSDTEQQITNSTAVRLFTRLPVALAICDMSRARNRLLDSGVHPIAVDERQLRDLLENLLLTAVNASFDGILQSRGSAEIRASVFLELLAQQGGQALLSFLHQGPSPNPTPVAMTASTADGERVDLELTLLAMGERGREFDQVACVLTDQTDKRRLALESTLYQQQLEQLVSSRNRDLLSQMDFMRRAEKLIEAIMSQGARGVCDHMARVSLLAGSILKRLQVEDDLANEVNWAAHMHDVGMNGIPREIVGRADLLTQNERRIIQQHSALGRDIVRSAEMPFSLTQMILQHHEREDGSGYPQGLGRNELCLGAKVIAVADVVEAICTDRVYRPALGVEAAISELLNGRRSRYNSDVVDACVAVMRAGFSFVS